MFFVVLQWMWDSFAVNVDPKTVVDTQVIAWLQSHCSGDTATDRVAEAQQGLEKLYQKKLHAPPDKMHNGGNDAYYTMALLLTQMGVPFERLC